MFNFFFKKKIHSFYVETSFQLLQVYELIKLENIKNFKILIRLNHVVRNNQQLRKLVKVLNLKDVKYVKTFKYNKINLIFLVFKVFISIINSKKIYIEENCGVFKLLIIFFKKGKFVLIDDGIATLHKNLKFKSYDRFSIYNNISPKTRLNTFTNIKKLALKNKTKKKSNIIVGSNYVEENIIKQEIYFKMLRFIKSKTKTNRLIYIPHRNENKKKLKIIQNNFGITVTKTKLPIELLNYELGVSPLVVHNTTSTAMFSMKLIYKKTKFISYKFNNKHLIERKKYILKFYKIMDNFKFIKKIQVD